MNCLRGLEVDRLPFIEVAGMPWCYQEVQGWHYQGIPKGSEPRLAFGFDCAGVEGAVQGFEVAPVDWYAVPRFPEPALPDDGLYKRAIDGRWGRTRRGVPPQDAGTQIGVRIFEDHLVQTPDDWQAFKEHFRITPEGRYPEDWDQWVAHSQKAAHPIALNLLGFGAVQNIIGLEGETGFFMSIHDRPQFLKEMIEHFTEFVITVADKALLEARIDFVMLGEQLAGDDGPMIGPDVLEEFFLDGYCRVVEHVRGRGADIVIFRADGNVLPFAPMLIDAGFNGLMGIPQKMDLPGLKKRYGDGICMIGGLDRWALLKSPADIERDIDAKMAIARQGRIIPCLDGSVMPEVSLENYRHYARYLRESIDRLAAGR